MSWHDLIEWMVWCGAAGASWYLIRDYLYRRNQERRARPEPTTITDPAMTLAGVAKRGTINVAGQRWRYRKTSDTTLILKPYRWHHRLELARRFRKLRRTTRDLRRDRSV
jgi:hypothetical protein